VETVLVVDDDADLRRMYRTALAFAGYRVLEAGDGLDALRLLEGDRPDVVVLDLDLPLISGQTVRQELAARAHTRDIPVVVVTGLPGEHEELKPGCVLRKPVSPDRLIATVRKYKVTSDSASAAP
jgi:CheY-like chemotaxis protein